MAYATFNFKTKKALKEAVVSWSVANALCSIDKNMAPFEVKCFNHGLGPDLSNFTGKVCLEGPHYPAAHTWYAEAELIEGVVVKVK